MRTKYQQPLQEEAYYHLYNRAVTKSRLFYQSDNYHFFMRKWEIYGSPYCDLLAYCLIPNHFHFVIRVKPLNDDVREQINRTHTRAAQRFIAGEIGYSQFLESQFQRLFLCHALAIKKQEKRNGALFQKSFKRVLIKTEEHLLRTIAYVHHNPIHHLSKSNYSDWKHSSYSDYLRKQPRYISKDFLREYLQFDGNKGWKKQYKDVHKEYRIYFNPKLRWKDNIIFD